jgi:hypothetical protein
MVGMGGRSGDTGSRDRLFLFVILVGRRRAVLR